MTLLPSRDSGKRLLFITCTEIMKHNFLKSFINYKGILIYNIARAQVSWSVDTNQSSLYRFKTDDLGHQFATMVKTIATLVTTMEP